MSPETGFFLISQITRNEIFFKHMTKWWNKICKHPLTAIRNRHLSVLAHNLVKNHLILEIQKPKSIRDLLAITITH